MTETGAPSVQGVQKQQDTAAQRSQSRGTEPGHSASQLVTEHGRTSIAGDVVAKVAGMAAREIAGVHDFGGGAARAFGAIRDKLGADEGVTRGISVDVGERQAAVDVDLVVDYGVTMPDLADAVRTNVISAVERMCGLEVTEVNVLVDDVYLPRQEELVGARPERRVE
jgi:uncharacterized alkaline shock family protein YloU